MSYGLGSSRQRQQRRQRAVVVKWSLALAAIFGAGYFAYDTGVDLAREDVVILKGDLGRAADEIVDLKKQNADLYVANQDLRKRDTAMRARLAKEIPTGEKKTLLQEIDKRLADGVRPERMSAVIGAVENELVCEGEAETRRFLVRTPIYQGANDSVAFADGTITVSASGQSFRNASGSPEAWFDPAKPVTIQLARLGGSKAESAGLLPLHASIVVGDTDYRFTVAAAERTGFVTVTGQGCRFP
jgi:hypothetical protein